MASRYWVGGGSAGNWSSTGNTNWSATDGGANNATVPTAGDDVFFTANSGSATATISANITVGSLDCTGYTGTITWGSGVVLTLDGGGAAKICKIVAGMTLSRGSGTSGITFTNTTGTATLTSAGKTMPNITLNGTGGTTQLQDNLTTGSNVVTTITLGVLDTNGKNITTGGMSIANSANASATNVTGSITIQSSSGFSVAGSSAVVTLTSATIVMDDFASSGTCALANKSLGTLTVNANTGTNAGPVTLSYTSGTTIATFNASGPRRITLNQGNTLNITNAFNWTGPLFIGSSSPGTQYTIAAGASSTIGSNSSPAIVQDMNTTTSSVSVTGFSLINNSFSAGGITAPSGGGGGRMIGG